MFASCMIQVVFLKAKFLDRQEGERFEEKAYRHAIQTCNQIIVEFSDSERWEHLKILVSVCASVNKWSSAISAFKISCNESPNPLSCIFTEHSYRLSPAYNLVMFPNILLALCFIMLVLIIIVFNLQITWNQQQQQHWLPLIIILWLTVFETMTSPIREVIHVSQG